MPRWKGYCHGCQRSGLEVETRHEHHAMTLCDRCAHKPRPAPPASGRRQGGCGGCGQHTDTEFSLHLDARFCDRCYWQAIRAREAR